MSVLEKVQTKCITFLVPIEKEIKVYDEKRGEIIDKNVIKIYW